MAVVKRDPQPWRVKPKAKPKRRKKTAAKTEAPDKPTGDGE